MEMFIETDEQFSSALSARMLSTPMPDKNPYERFPHDILQT